MPDQLFVSNSAIPTSSKWANQLIADLNQSFSKVSKHITEEIALTDTINNATTDILNKVSSAQDTENAAERQAVANSNDMCMIKKSYR